MSENFWGELIRSLRLGEGVSQRTLAPQLGISRSTLRRIENGEMAGEITLIEKILERFGYELDAMPVSDPGARPKPPERP